jgi:hypothetical protein
LGGGSFSVFLHDVKNTARAKNIIKSENAVDLFETKIFFILLVLEVFGVMPDLSGKYLNFKFNKFIPVNSVILSDKT